MRITSLAGVVGVLLVPLAARADTVCAPSSPVGFYACASITLTWSQNAIVMDVRNLDAWDATFSNVVGGYRLTGFGINGSPSFTQYLTGAFAVDIAGAVGGGTKDPDNYWDYATTISGGIEVQLGASSGNVGWIEGCYDTGGKNDRYITCDPTYDGVVRFTFGTSGLSYQQFSQMDLGYAVRGSAGSGKDKIAYKCEDGIGSPPDCTVTAISAPQPPPGTFQQPGAVVSPEPVTMLLLATGLLGVGGAARRRRRETDV